MEQAMHEVLWMYIKSTACKRLTAFRSEFAHGLEILLSKANYIQSHWMLQVQAFDTFPSRSGVERTYALTCRLDQDFGLC